MNFYETNAYYSLLNNQIVFPAGILQDPFFSPDASFETNLGGIGTIIGHEISHGFDDQGRKFDSEGNLKTWWLDSDIHNYTQKIQPIIEQFNQIKLFNINISGKMTLGENIADYTAVTIITNILNNLNATKEQFKTMYKSYANIWKQKIRQNELIKKLHTDYHAPGRYRTNLILSNIPEFKKIYRINSDHPMYISPDKCVQLWN
jgi:putative endopeptidase